MYPKSGLERSGLRGQDLRDSATLAARPSAKVTSTLHAPRLSITLYVFFLSDSHPDNCSAASAIGHLKQSGEILNVIVRESDVSALLPGVK